MHYQLGQLGRDLLNNPRMYQDVFGAVEDAMSGYGRVADGRNAVFGIADFSRRVVHAAACGGQVAGCARSASGIGGAACPPTRTARGRWPFGWSTRAPGPMP